MAGRVIDRAWNDVRRARFSNGEGPLRLEELLAAYPDVSINLDLKEGAVVAPALDALRRAAAWHRVCLTSFSTRRLRAARRWAPTTVETSAGPAEVVLQRATPPRLSRWRARPGPAGRQSRPGRAGPTRLQVPARLVTATYVTRAHAQSLPVDAWTVNDPAEMDRLLRIDVDGIMTDAPALLRDVLRSHGRW